MVHRNYHNGLKTTLLLGGMWALLLAIGVSPACRGSNDAIPPGAAVVRVGCSRQSADPLSKNSQISWNFGEWVYGLAKATAWNHYAHTHKPTQPASSNS